MALDTTRSMVLALVLALVVAACASSASEDVASASNDCDSTKVFDTDVAQIELPTLNNPVWVMSSDEATFSSPRVADLNGDSVLDVVQGFGQDTLGAEMSSVVATNGATGEELWRSSGHEDMIGSPQFAQLAGDSTVDVVIGGRRGALVALDGATGQTIWTFDTEGDRWFNFYTSQIVSDQNGDGRVDIVAANGGLVFDEPKEGGGLPDADQRHLGTTFLISGSDGSVISSVPVPDRRESYMSPVVVGSDVLIGTGGETLAGSLWRVPLSALAGDNSNGSVSVVSGGNKGVIAAPSVADLTLDCVLDIVVQSFDGTVSLIDGATNESVWAVTNVGFETYSSPTLGYFVGDDATPDVFASVASGTWPEYVSADYLLIDGATGQVVWRETLGTFAPSGFVAADVNGDGRDEVVFGVNDVVANTQQLFVLEPERRQLRPLGEPFGQTTFAAPWLGDLDQDGKLDLIVTESAYQSKGPARVTRFALDWETPAVVSWGAYLGTDGTGSLS